MARHPTKPCMVCRQPCCTTENCDEVPICHGSCEVYSGRWVCSPRCWETVAMLEDCRVVLRSVYHHEEPRSNDAFVKITLDMINKWFKE